MKKLLLFAMIMLLGGGLLFAQNTIDVSGLKVEAGTVTFNVEWSDAGASNLWSDTVWVFVDYNKNGRMARMELLLGAGATLTATSSPGVGKLEEVSGNTKGAWVVGDARTNGSFSATVQLLTATADLHGACAYASSYPPVGQYVSPSEIVFAGTPMYEIKLLHTDGYTIETIESGGTFLLPCDYSMSSFTDATGAPGIIKCLAPANLTFASQFAAVCAGETVTLTASATGAAQYRINDGLWQVSPVFEVSPSSTTSYTLYAKTDDECVASVAGAAVVTVNPLPAISLSSGDASQSVYRNTAIATIVYTATDATGISLSSGSFPAGVDGNYSNGSYTISGTPAVDGIFNYTVTTANGNGCADATASGTITVTQPQGSCTYTEPAVVGTFADFHNTSAYSASTYVSLVDERDDKVYPVVKIGGRWIMARNLNYQKDLTWEANANSPSTVTYHNAALIGHFWCPGGYSATAVTSTRESCEVWGALYSWETAMLLDGYGTWTEVNAYNIAGANAANSDYNHGRTAHSGTGTGGRGICPPNWHVPTDNEWGRLSDAMETVSGGTTHQTAAGAGWYGSDAGIHAKAVCTLPGNISGSAYVSDTQVNWYYLAAYLGADTYNFHVLPAGVRDFNGSKYYARGGDATFWSSTSEGLSLGHHRDFDSSHGGVYRNSNPRSYGFSIRCIKD